MMFDDLKNESSANDSEGVFDSISRTITEAMVTVGIRVTCLSFIFSQREQEKTNPKSNEVKDEESDILIKSGQHFGA
jgi:hypothetical protein